MANDEERLIGLLNRFGQGSRHKLEVYFDGAPPGQSGKQTYGRVQAHFVPSRQTADQAIRTRLARLKKSAAEWVVVSSDREILRAAREMHAGVLHSEEFAEYLENSLQTPLEESSSPGDQPLSEAEVNEWLSIFRSRSRKK